MLKTGTAFGLKSAAQVVRARNTTERNLDALSFGYASCLKIYGKVKRVCVRHG